jgi:hypothetical protein
VEKVLRVTAKEDSSARKLCHLDAPKAACGSAGAKDFIEAPVKRRGAVLLRRPIRSREERRRHGHAHEPKHENRKKPCEAFSNLNLKYAKTAVNS